MKCRACWSDKAYIREVKGFQGMLLSWLLRVPLKCHHCYHKFTVSWFSTIGKQTEVPQYLIDRTRVAPAESFRQGTVVSAANAARMPESRPRTKAA